MTTTSADPHHRYGLTEACKHCPFRTDIEPYLRHERAQEIARGLREGGEFPCHVTTERRTDEHGDDTLVDGPRSRFCAGALAVLENEGNPNQMMRVAERMGFYDPAKLGVNTRRRAYRSLIEWVRAHAPETAVPYVVDTDGTRRPYEHCGVVEGDCEDPAGYAVGGGAMENEDEPTCHPIEDQCEGCGHTACAACRSEQWDDKGGKFCLMCWQPENDEDEDAE